MEDPFIGNWDGISRYYLDYYNERICKLFIVYDSDKNPFRSLMSLAMNNSVLKKAILALAARHRANNALPFLSWDHSNSPQLIDAHRDALLFKHQAIQGLSQTLRDESSSFSDTTVASVFLLIFLDLLESGSDQWNFHLEGAKRLMAMIQPHGKLQDKPQVDPGRTVQGIRDFINSQIYLIETLGATFVRPKLLSQFSRPEHKKGQETVEESFLGCPVFLLTAVQHLSEQRDAIADSGPPGDFLSYHYMSNITEILHFIRSFDCYTWSANQPQDSQYSTHPTNNLHILSRSYQIGAIIYGECIIAAAEGKPFLNDSLVEELIDLITTLKNDHTLFKCILWPIFVAGLECRVQSQRDFLISCLEKFWSDTSCQNVMNAAKILQEYWERNDRPTTGTSQWVFEIGHLGHDWLLI